MNLQKTAQKAALLAAILSVFLAGCVSGDVLESASSSDAALAEAKPVANGAEAAGLIESSQLPVPAANGALPGVETYSATPEEVPVETRMAYAPDAVEADPAGDPTVAIDRPAVPDASPSAALQPGDIEPPVAAGPSKTYLINGLMSAVPFIGYGFRHLSEKMPDAKLYSYLTPVEGAAAVYPAIVSDIEKAYAKNPSVSVNLIGISLGADMASAIAENLAKKGIPVNYLGIVDGTNLRPVQDNVRKADNLTCSNIDCTRARVRLAKGNTVTVFERKVYRSSHIPLGDNDELHARVMAQVASR